MAAPNNFADFKVLRAEQATFGTAISAADAVTLLEVEPTVIEPIANIIETGAASGSRHLDEIHIVANQYQLTPEFSIAGNLDLLEAAHQLYSFFQNVVQGGSSPYSYTYTLPSTQPDFNANAGYFGCYVLKTATASTHRLIKDAISRELTLICDPADYLKLNATLIGRGAVDIVFNSTGTITRNTPAYWHYGKQLKHTIDFGGGAQDITLTGGWQMKFSQEVIPYGHDATAGDYYGFALDKRRMEFTGTILWDANARSCESDLIAGNFAEFNILWGNDPGSASADLEIDFHGYFSKVVMNQESPAGVEITVQMIGRETTTAIEPCTIVLWNTADNSWT